LQLLLGLTGPNSSGLILSREKPGEMEKKESLGHRVAVALTG
jgi:hypothetical protein